MENKKVGVIGLEDFEDAKYSTNVDTKRKKQGGFQNMGFTYPVLKGILKRGYKVPTPIQRKTIPVALEGRDIVGMARTGSGKTACFLLPLFEKLKDRTGSGIRALILSPTRELAIQTLKFLKELGRFTTLRSILILGGDPMESQFSSIHGNPDIVVATPGRFLHICIEMQLKLNNVKYVVFDEADRLFEMGFSEQLTEILSRLPETRQTLLFSATLPKVLVQFAKAGLNDPVLIRLDVESKIPDTLELGFFFCRPEEREAALLCLLKHVNPDSMTVVFAATKHHVEFLHTVLEHAGISNTYIYSDLDQTARKINAAKFQNGNVKVLVVTDVAARGIDIPQLDYVINFHFPAKPKLFVHRVGRCARAGRRGQAFSLVSKDELCYMLDLHLFLGRPLMMVTDDHKIESSKDCYFGKIPQSLIEEELSALMIWNTTSSDVEPLTKVSVNGYKNYIKSRPGASKDSVRRAKNIDIEKLRIHPAFPNNKYCAESKRLEFIHKVKNYKPRMTIFELGQSSNSVMSLSARFFRKINRENIDSFYRKKKEVKENDQQSRDTAAKTSLENSDKADIEETFQEIVTSRKRRKLHKTNNSNTKKKYAKIDLENYVPYKPSDDRTEKGLAVNDIQLKSAGVMLDITGDTTDMIRTQKRVDRKWDPMKRKYITNNNKEKMIKSESGHWIPISYKTDRYMKWQEKTKARRDQDDNSDDIDRESSALQPGSSMRLNTHWGKHNLKLYEKQQNPSIKINTERILKMRKLKEKRRLRNRRKPSKTKTKKKSAKFNKM